MDSCGISIGQECPESIWIWHVSVFRSFRWVWGEDSRFVAAMAETDCIGLSHRSAENDAPWNPRSNSRVNNSLWEWTGRFIKVKHAFCRLGRRLDLKPETVLMDGDHIVDTRGGTPTVPSCGTVEQFILLDRGCGGEEGDSIFCIISPLPKALCKVII